MVLFLKNRERFKEEKMDDPNCDPVLLDNTYRQFVMINRLLSGWKHIYKRWLKPKMTVGECYTVLDIGAGGGDVPLSLIAWAEADGYTLSITAIDPDPRAFDYMLKLDLPTTLVTRCCSSFDLLDTGEAFDFVISNNVLHHLPESELPAFLDSSQSLAKNFVIHNDIVRDDFAFLGFAALSKLFFHKSFISYDGLLSVRRSFTKQELEQLIPTNWRLKSALPFRHLLMYEVTA